MGKIAVALSGGVDSAVAALQLREQGEEVVGIFMKNWEDATPHPLYRTVTKPGCHAEEDFKDVRAVCQLLDIPSMTLDFVEGYRERVFQVFLSELRQGRTPNPDILCNQEIKFHLFLEKALQLPGVTAIATGHYARNYNNQLWRPRDRAKDQTYFLYRMPRWALPHVLFPLHNLLKAEVRDRARHAKLPNAEKKDSTGICFIGDVDYKAFLREHLSDQPGDIMNTVGQVIGRHRGLHLYTVGQRHGINIGGTGPYYVVAKKSDIHTLVVTNNAHDPQLFQSACMVHNVHWLGDHSEKQLQRCDVQIRFRQVAQPAHVTLLSNNIVSVKFEKPQRAITPGQSAVFYDGDCVLGGGIISTTS